MKKSIVLVLAALMLMCSALAGCGGNKEQKVTCTMCNGSGEVKYYYGDGDNDYNMGSCTSCDGTGYVMIKPTGNSNGGKRVICGSCGKYVDELITKNDAAGESRTWCADCWAEYDSLMGRQRS